ncbi:MAG: hypothetical protein AB9869_36975 [Verrucomicrobiia bacterium]
MDVIEGTRTPDIISGYDLNLENMTAEHLVNGKFGKSFQFDNERKALLKRVHNAGDKLPIYNHPAFTVSVWVNGPIQTDHRVYCESRSTANQPMFSIGTHQTGVSSGLGSGDGQPQVQYPHQERRRCGRPRQPRRRFVGSGSNGARNRSGSDCVGARREWKPVLSSSRPVIDANLSSPWTGPTPVQDRRCIQRNPRCSR